MDHISEIAKVTCKVCRISLRRKNYKFHLKNTHPKENSDYLSGLSQPKITSLLPQSTSSHSRKSTVVPQLGDDVEDAGTVSLGVFPMAEGEVDSTAVEQGHQVSGEVPDVSVNKDSLKRNKCDDDLPRKKRFKSGDSAFGDVDYDIAGDLSVKAAIDKDNESSKLDINIIELQPMKNDLKDLKKKKDRLLLHLLPQKVRN